MSVDIDSQANITSAPQICLTIAWGATHGGTYKIHAHSQQSKAQGLSLEALQPGDMVVGAAAAAVAAVVSPLPQPTKLK